jgi:nicotinate-nucleotide adenylyltransferase
LSQEVTRGLLISMSQTKTALFGGTFDPIHRGHIDVARSALDIIGADKLIFVPARHSALKTTTPVASDADRLYMIRLAIAGIEGFGVSDWELKRPGPSYTIDTVRHFQQTLGSEMELYWLLGADSIGELPRWYKIQKLIDECFLSCMYRAGYEPPDFSRFTDSLGAERVKKLQDNIIETPLVDISSTQIRARLAKGQDADDMLKPKVAEYVREKKLYR